MDDRAAPPTLLALEDLSNYSDWPARLLALESSDVKFKTEQEVLREFEYDKWGELLKRVRLLEHPTLDEVERNHLDFHAIAPRYDRGTFVLGDEEQMLQRHVDFYAEVLCPHLDGASCLVELGAGYGSKLFRLSERPKFSTVRLIAGEYTRSGRELISILAKSLKKRVDIGHCDFRRLTIEDVSIPDDAVIFTSYAVHYVPELPADFVAFLSRLNPRAVVHFEPCYEHYATDSPHGAMCRRYVELNDYTRNLVSVINASRIQGDISVRMRRNVLGSNPFLPISAIEWAPVGRSEILA